MIKISSLPSFPLTLLLTLHGASVRFESGDASSIGGPMGADRGPARHKEEGQELAAWI